MGVSDRDYMRGQNSAGAFGLTASQFIWWLIGINVAVYLLPALPGHWGYVGTPAEGYRLGGYSTHDLLAGKFWKLFTYPFVHQSVLHLLMNMVGLYLLGRQVLRSIGIPSFLVLYFGGGVAGALLETAIRSAFGPTQLMGASAAVLAVTAMFVTLLPNAQMQILPLPFLIQARTLLWAFLIFNGLFGLLTIRSELASVAYFAHCGGALWGLAHGRYVHRWLSSLPSLHPAPRKPEAPAVRYTTRPDDTKIIDAEFTEAPDGDYNAVLDKINRTGIGSLTPRERRILEQASERLGRNKH